MSTNAQLNWHIVSLQHVSTLKGTPAGSINETFQQQGQQNESSDVKFWNSNKTYLQVRL